MGLWSILPYIFVLLSMPPLYREHHITLKELLPVVIGAVIWGPNWFNKSILCWCDNKAVVHIINTGTSKDPQVMGLMRCLHFIAARFNFLLSAIHTYQVLQMPCHTITYLPFLITTWRPLASLLLFLWPCSTYWSTPSQTGHHLHGAACSTLPSVSSQH